MASSNTRSGCILTKPKKKSHSNPSMICASSCRPATWRSISGAYGRFHRTHRARRRKNGLRFRPGAQSLRLSRIEEERGAEYRDDEHHSLMFAATPEDAEMEFQYSIRDTATADGLKE